MVRFGDRDVVKGGPELAELRDSSDLREDVVGLRDRLEEDGYVLVRQLLPRGDVLAARRALVAALADGGHLAAGVDADLVQAADGAPEQVGLDGISVDDAVRGTVEHPALFAFVSSLLGQPVITFPYKWLRAVCRGGFTGVHADTVYMPRGSQRLHTTWIAFGDIPSEQGTLAILPGSHRLESYAKVRETYGQMDLDRDRVSGGGWLTSDPHEMTAAFGGQWATTDFRAGDILIFSMNTLHASTTNTTDRFRLSCDVRWQPAADPVDPRYVQAVPTHDWLGTGEPPRVLLEDARAAWGV